MICSFSSIDFNFILILFISANWNFYVFFYLNSSINYLDRIMYPENGYNCASACVEIAERLLGGEDPDDIRTEIGDEEI